MSGLLQDNKHEPPVSVQVHGVVKDKENGNIYAQIRDERKHPDLQIIRDHLARIAKLSGNEKLSPRERISKLTDLGKLYADGYPFKNSQRLNALQVDGVPLLSRQAHAAADQLLSIEKARYGRDVGKMGNQE